MTAAELKQARFDRGLTITQMAELLNTPRGTYQKWENGDRRVPGIVEVALRKCEKYKTMVDTDHQPIV